MAISSFSHHIKPCFFPWSSSRSSHANSISIHASQALQSSSPGGYNLRCDREKIKCLQMLDSHVQCSDGVEKMHERGDSDAVLCMQTLTKFPIQKLHGKVVMVRFDSTLLLREASDSNIQMESKAVLTIKHLHGAGAKVILVGDWDLLNSEMVLSVASVAENLSTVLELNVVPENGSLFIGQSRIDELKNADILLLENLSKFREETANCSLFSEKLTSGIDIFVNDAFSQSHKALASTVGVTRFCYASIAGFQFEKELSLATAIVKCTKQPYVVIIGGSNSLKKSVALRHLASICDGIVFVGRMAFQLLHAFGLPVSSRFLEHGHTGDISEIIKLVQSRNAPIFFPEDFWCMNDACPEFCNLYPSCGILSGWTPVSLGPCSLIKFSTFLSKSKKLLWIGPVNFSTSIHNTSVAYQLAMEVEKLGKRGCDVTIVGNAACEAVMGTTTKSSSLNIFKNASVIWEFLKGRVLPGVAALDRAYPFELCWNKLFVDATQPLVVDIGSGNGLFLLRMASRWKSSNFLGLEINRKLVKCCLDAANHTGLKNLHFLQTNATSTFWSIVSKYPGDLVLVTIQCPNPDFNKENYRWRMLQRGLVEAIIYWLAPDGKIFLQSDVEAVAIRMKELFMTYGEGKIDGVGGRDENDERGWLKENPFGMRSDWEQHVLDRGAPMYRLLYSKVKC